MILIFALYKKEAARLENALSRGGWSGLVGSIHDPISLEHKEERDDELGERN